MFAKKLLFFPYTEQLGTTLRLLRIACALRKTKKYQILFASSGRYTSIIKDFGFEVINIIEFDQKLYRQKVDNSKLDIFSISLLEKFIKQEIQVINEYKPDLIIEDTRWSLAISSKITNVKRVTVINSNLTRYSKMRTFIPSSHKLYPLRHFLNPFASTIKKLYFKIWTKNYNIVLRKYGLKKMNSLYDIFMGDFTILSDHKSIIPIQKNIPNNVFICGPLVVDNITHDPSWSNSILKNKKVIYLSLGSTGKNYEKILNLLINIVKDRKDFQLVSNYVDLTSQKPVNKYSNIFIEKFLPVEKILPLTDIMIHHGGAGVMYHALKHGIPSIAIPNQGEQEWNALHIHKRKWGVFIDSNQISKKILERNLFKLFSNKKIHKNLQKSKRALLSLNIDEEIINIFTMINNEL